MRLYIDCIDRDVTFTENQVCVLSLELTDVFRNVLADLWKQSEGLNGSILLSEDDGTPVKLKDKMVCIFNPFALDVNEKRIINQLYKELSMQVQESLPEAFADYHHQTSMLMERIAALSSFSLDYEPDVQIADLFKICHLELRSESENLLEQLLDYIQVQRSLCHKTCFVLVNIKQFFSEKEMAYLYEFSLYEKLQLIVIESLHSPKREEEKTLIVDSDRCIIELD